MFNKVVYLMSGFWILFGIACIIGGDPTFGGFAVFCGTGAILAVKGWI